MEKRPKRILIMGAAGRDFHNFNTYYRNNSNYHVVCFTTEQIPGISGRKYPPVLSGKRYPKGIPIYSETDLTKLIKKYNIDEVVLSYSDLSHQTVMEKASTVNAAGASFVLLSPEKTMIKSKKKVIAVCAVRTGCGKSSTSQKIALTLTKKGKKVAVIRHPMPYGDLAKQICQRFASYADMKKEKCTIEEMEEYEPYVTMGIPIFAGVDYEKILRRAEKEADVVLWDGGNNDTPFYKPDVFITIADPHRLGHEQTYYPGAINVRMSDIVVINKAGTAPLGNVAKLEKSIKQLNPKVKIIKANSAIYVEDAQSLKGKKAIVIEDGPTLTHGGMKYGAGTIAAKKYGAKLIDPKKYAVGSIKRVLQKYPKLQKLVPAMGYGKKQMKELQTTINKAKADVVIVGTPIDLGKLLKLNKPTVRVKYKLEELGGKNIVKMIQRV